MKYLIWPFVAITLVVIVTLIQAPLKFMWHLAWHLEIITFQHATSVRVDGKRGYLYDCAPKQFLLELLVYNYSKRNTHQDDNK
jgi:hypothetical protein